jgi:small subunit ribosomal protein S5
MTTEDTNKDVRLAPEDATPGTAESYKPKTTSRIPQRRRGPGNGGGGDNRGPRRGGGRGDERKDDFDQKNLSMRRVTRVVAGGRRFSLAAAVVVGDRKGKVGVGTGKAIDTALAISKATKVAKRKLITIPLTKDRSIPHEVKGKYHASAVWLSPNKNKGIVAGGPIRDILALAGVKNVTAKILRRSKNRLNNAEAVIRALSSFSPKRSGKTRADASSEQA